MISVREMWEKQKPKISWEEALRRDPGYPWAAPSTYRHDIVWIPAVCEACGRQFWFQLQRDRQPAPRKCDECEPPA